MQSQSSETVRTFAIGIPEQSFDESYYARKVAGALGTDHTELQVSPGKALELIPRLPDIYDEPFADVSQIPTYLVSEMTRKHVTVALSGDGGDETCAGYARHFLGGALWNALRVWPSGMRKTVARGLNLLSEEQWDVILKRVQGMLPGRLGRKSLGDRFQKLVKNMPARNRAEFCQGLVSWWLSPLDAVIGGYEPKTFFSWEAGDSSFSEFAHYMQYADLCTYLPDDILTKVDRASMAVGLEARSPFLDHRFVELSWRIPLSKKIDSNQGKIILKRILSKYLPQDLVDRPKAGFGLPLASWLRGPLREWAESQLSSYRLEQEGYLRAAPIRRMWKQHLEKRRNWQHHLWSVLMFQSWLENQKRT